MLVSSRRRLFTGLAPLVAPCLFPAQAKADGPDVEVGLALACVVDSSGSIDFGEARLQRDGYVDAFRDPEIIDRILDKGGAALGYIEYATVNTARTVVKFRNACSAAAITAFADELAAAHLESSGWTSISSGVDHARLELDRICPAAAMVPRIIDVSGDGPNNSGRPAQAARDDALKNGIRINGLPILDGSQSSQNLEEYYYDNVVTPQFSINGQNVAAGFVIVAKNFASFGQAVRAKLGREVAEADTPRRRMFAVRRPAPGRRSTIGWVFRLAA